MGKIAYLDCFSGASGDMFLGALLDAGLPVDSLREALGSLALDGGGWTVETSVVDRAGVAATKLSLHEGGAAAKLDNHAHHNHGHGHHHPHRSLKEIVGLIDRSALSSEAKNRASRLFGRLAEAEAAILGAPEEQCFEQIYHDIGGFQEFFWSFCGVLFFIIFFIFL